MTSKKPKGIDDKISAGFVVNSSENVFEIKTHRMQNVSYCQKRKSENFWFSRDNSNYFNSPKLKAKVHVVFNNSDKEFIESIYNSHWDLIYSKY